MQAVSLVPGLQENLIRQREASQGQAVYCLCAEGARAGAFILGYIIGSAPRREWFAITPDGYYFRKKVGRACHLARPAWAPTLSRRPPFGVASTVRNPLAWAALPCVHSGTNLGWDLLGLWTGL